MAEKIDPQQVEEIQKTEEKQSNPAFMPRVDIYENDGTMILVADMPGVDENSLDISLEKNILTINGYVSQEQPAGYALAHREYRVGDYQRRFKLANSIDQDNIEATIKEGVLRLHMPKIELPARNISVSAG